MNETIEINDLALTDDQQGDVKGGPVVMQDVLVTGFQHSGSSSAATSGIGALQSIDGRNTWII